MRKHIFLLPFLIWATTGNTLEINHYTISFTGIFHDVTVAFDDLNKGAMVRCLIEKDGKPVGKKDQFIEGVGTIQIMISGGVMGDTRASCAQLP